MTASEPAWHRDRALLALLTLSLALNAWGLDWGLPSAFGWAPDELLPETVLAGASQAFSAGWHSKYPALHHVLLLASYAPFLLAEGWRPGSPPSAATYERLFLAGRVLSLFMGLGVVALVHACGRHLLTRRGALFASALAATLLPFVYYAKLANLDVPYLFWWLLSLWFQLRLLDSGRRRDLLGAAVSAALSIATKDQAYALYVLTIPAGLAYWARRTGRYAGQSTLLRWVNTLRDRDLLAAGLAALATLALSYNLLFNWQGFMAHVALITGSASRDFRLFPATLEGHWGLLVQSLANLAFCLGPGATLVCLAGLLTLLVRAQRQPAVRGPLAFLLLPAASYYLTFIAVVLYSYDRFLLPIALLATFCGGGLLAEGWAWAGWRGRLARLATVFVFVHGLGRALSLDVLMVHDARYAAEAWLRAHVAPDADVAGVGSLPQLPRLDGLRWRIVPPAVAALSAAPADFLVVNADLARRSRAGSGRASFYARLEGGSLGYREVRRWRTRRPWLLFDTERLQGGAFGPVLSNLERVNPEIVLYARPTR
jgi:hypothetical protein